MPEPREKRDLVLPPGTYAYMQDVTKGVVKVYTGPQVINPTAQERAVKFENGQFRPCDLDNAMQLSPVAPEGFYITLQNPSEKNTHPSDGTTQPSPDLNIGRRINIPGPATFPLWPQQVAEVIEGHHLKYNQYLLIRVSNEEEAKQNWGTAVMKPVTNGEAAPTAAGAPKDLTMGKLYIIKGTECSFYIPPTGITVVPDGKNEYVRDALTLEQLEYAILVDEAGTKRYEYGPKVVFPMPTEKFFYARGKGEDNKSQIKFRAIELNPIQGLHVKVIADYDEPIPDGAPEGFTPVHHKTGEELFITGKDTAIYYPREEHAIVKYDGKTKHFATAIPPGEGRYVLGRETGVIKKVEGPTMLLPDPRVDVIVRRALSDAQCGRWYPGNDEALLINRELRNVLKNSPTTRSGAISEGDLSRGLKKGSAAKGLAENALDRYNTLIGTAATANFGDYSKVSGDQDAAGEEISRGSTYTQPRSITLDTKYQGVPGINVWAGYAVMVVDKHGGRRVEQGPKTILLEYDEDLEVLSLSTGKPKNTDTLYNTVYLRTDNNTVTDIMEVETSDHVNVRLKLVYRVNFTGEDQAKWFSVENYVKFLCDHVRSVLKGLVRSKKVEEFYLNASDIIRSAILGAPVDGKRKGMLFSENGMLVTDVEVLEVAITDTGIRDLLNQSQQLAVRSNIDLENARRVLKVEAEKQAITRATLEESTKTALKKNELQIDTEASSLAVKLAVLTNAIQASAEQAKLDEVTIASEAKKLDARLTGAKSEAEQRLALMKVEQDQKLAALVAETESTVKRLEAIKGGFSEALLALSNNETLAKVAEAFSIQRIIGGENVSEAINRAFAGTALEGLVKRISGTPIVPGSGTDPARNQELAGIRKF